MLVRCEVFRRTGDGLKGFIFALLLLRDTLLGSPALRGCISLLMRCAVSWCPCLRSVLVSVLTDDGFIFVRDRLKSPLYGLLESALAVQCSGVFSDDGLTLPLSWSPMMV